MKVLIAILLASAALSQTQFSPAPTSASGNSLATYPIQFTISGQGSAITAGGLAWKRVPVSCTIQSVTLMADQSGSTVIDVQTSAAGNSPSYSSIAASAKPTLSAARYYTDSTLTGWTAALTAGSYIEIVVNSATTVQQIDVSITCKIT